MNQHGQIYICGDTHAEINSWKISHKKFHCDKNDLLIVCGDNGFIWEWDVLTNPKSKRREMFNLNVYVLNRRFIMASVLGNHENYARIYSDEFKEEELYGGKIIRIAPNFFFFKNGEVYTINNQRFFVWGGARSTDKKHRTEGKSWWPEEIPSQHDFDNALKNLEKHNWCVDFVLSHTCSQSEIYYFMPQIAAHDATMKDFDPAGIMLQELMSRLSYQHHFFGHLHMDETIDNATCSYSEVRNLNLFMRDKNNKQEFYNELD